MSPGKPVSLMSYRYGFDDTRVGDLRLRRPDYETLYASYRQLRDALNEWNRRALENGARAGPYESEVDDLDRPTTTLEPVAPGMRTAEARELS